MEFLPLLLLLLFGCGRQLSSAGLLDYGGQTLGSDPLLQQPYDLLYAGGLREYHQYHWAKAVSLLERALLSHSALRRLRTRCQRLCVQQDPGGNSWDPLDSLQFFQSLLHRAACLQHCVTASLGQQSRHMVTETVQADFQRRTPYNYLQLIYYRLEQLDKAAAAAQTFFEANPDHQEMQENLEKYRQMEGVKEEDFKDLEAQPHWVSYREGMELHQAEQFAESIPRLEAAIREYMAELSECRAQCEGWYHPPDYAYLEYQSHLYEAISDHYVQVLGCSQDCVRELATKPGSGKIHKNFLPSHFYLLQSAYHKVGNYEKAVECSRTFLLFQPEDGSVCQNLEYYQSKLPAGRADEILPREDIKLHINESLLQKQMLYVAMESLGVPFNDPDSWTPAELIPQSLQGKRRPESSESPPDSPEIDTMQGKPLEIVTQINDDIQLLRASSSLFANLKVLMDSNQLSGNQRVVFDGVLTPEECAAIRSLANAATDLGTFSVSGSSTRLLSKHPETLTILRALKFAHEGLLRPDYAQLYYQASERARAVVQAHFRSKSPLHPSFSWLGCHTAQAGGSETGDAPRIAVQGGECLRNPEDAACWTEAVANPASEFSAFLYLNDEFEGGEFYFTDHDGKVISSEISPKCGRFVTFASGSENPHGVHSVTGGHRCAIALWFTHDHSQNEEERVVMAKLLDQLFIPLRPSADPGGPPQSQESQSPPRGNLPPDVRPRGEPGLQLKKTKKAKKSKKTGQAAETGSRSPHKDEL